MATIVSVRKPLNDLTLDFEVSLAQQVRGKIKPTLVCVPSCPFVAITKVGLPPAISEQLRYQVVAVHDYLKVA
jgi:hypothetical protein